MNAKDSISLQKTCEELEHKQPATPMRTDNNTSCGILTGMFKQNRIDFRIYWERGDTNLADYFTKFHPASHHRRVRPIYLNTINSPSSLQGCIELLRGHARPQIRPQVQLEVRHAASA